MIDAVVVAYGAVTSLGRGPDALPSVVLGAPPTCTVASDERLRALGLARTASSRLAPSSGVDAADPRRADAALAAAMSDCIDGLEAYLPDFRRLQVGLVLGTSSGAMDGAQRAYAALAGETEPAPEDAEDLAYAAPALRLLRHPRLGVPLARWASVLGACASSTLALGLAQTWLASGACDVVLAGGFDVVADLVAAGFVSLAAVTASSPQPFRASRDGLALGEAAVIAALVAAPSEGFLDRPAIAGFGASADAVHVTAPDREGRGIARAARRALAVARVTPGDIGLVSAHGTATPFNDAAEAAALRDVLGERQREVPTHALKGALGHALGGAGSVEVLATSRALDAGVVLPTAGEGPIDPDAWVALSDEVRAAPAEAALQTSLAFGGLNAALVLRRRAASPAPVPPVPAVFVAEAFADRARTLADLAARLGLPQDRVARVCGLSRLCLDAVASLALEVGRDALAGAGVVVGHDTANVAVNAAFHARLLARGARLVEPRRFPYTSPTASVGEVAIAFHLHGPALACGGGPGLAAQAEAIARDLVTAGHAPAMVVVEAAELSPAAVALFRAHGVAPPDAGWARARLLVGRPGDGTTSL